MVKVSTYLNFPGTAEEAFVFYSKVFRAPLVHEIQRMGDIPPEPGQPPIPESVKTMVLHVALSLPGGHLLMGSDAPEELGMHLTKGNSTYITLEPNSRQEALRLFDALSEGGKVEMPMQDTFWGAFYGSFQDRFGICWMINFPNPEAKTP